MSDVVIRTEGLSKKYLIGHETSRERYTTFRDVVVRAAKGLAKSAADMVRGSQLVPGDDVEEFWALKDVSFEVKRGEVVGIIGRNGAGKSTLLKILSRITEPSAGRVEIKGRVASLLEVGTGFHPELTGRENIYLNGAILGMTRAEIRRKFDEIVAFAEIEKFLDTPVKRYSNGMYVRLAFAVAAHLEPEILIIDEVLAIGDGDFQKKCLGKMQDVAGCGRTVLLVSHNMPVIANLCQRSLLMTAGNLEGPMRSTEAISQYLSIARTNIAETWTGPLLNEYFTAHRVRYRAPGEINIEGICHSKRENLAVGLRILADGNEELFETTSLDHCETPRPPPNEPLSYTVKLPIAVLRPGIYEAELTVFCHNEFWVIPPGTGPRIQFEVNHREGAHLYDTSRNTKIGPLIRWEASYSADAKASDPSPGTLCAYAGL
jgi:lipopolysaccharide transport system ATP-binding protein